MAPDTQTGRDSAASEPTQTGLLTLLFTDIASSTALKQQLGDRVGAALIQQHHALVRQLLVSCPGAEEIETAGDSFLVSFPKPSDAVRFALVLQARLRLLNQGHLVPLRDRIGIHLGEVVIQAHEAGHKPKDLYGIQIDTCSRVMTLAKGGQVLMSRGVFDSARQVLKGEDIEGVGPLEWLNHGPFLLKGLDEAEEICEVRETGQDQAPGPPTSSDKGQRQLRPDEEPVLGWRPAVGQVVPNTNWLLEQKLGEGGFGEVWVGRHQTLTTDHRVFKFCFRADRVRSLKREVTLFRLLKERVGEHPNIVRLYEVYFDHAPFYLEEEYVAGKDLRNWCKGHGGAEKLPLETRLEIVAQAGEALQAAHDAGIIHRDVKPGNILVAGELTGANPLLVKLTDFGIGQVVSQERLAGVTRAGFTMTLLGSASSSQTGTQVYMAPELMAGKPATTRSDIYSLGVVLYQLLIGDFSRPVTMDWPGLIPNPLLRDDLKHCFTGDPGERFGSAAEFARNLRRFKERQAERERREAEKVALERAAYRRGMMRMAAVATVIVALIAGLALVALSQSRRAARTAESLHRHLYCSDMAVAWQAWEEGDVERTRALLTNRLQALRPGNDLRGFEWRYLWGRSRPEELFVIPNGSSSVKFSPDGRLVATFGLSSGNVIKLWDLRTRKIAKSIKAYEREGWTVAFSPDGKMLATASRGDPDFKVWDVATGAQIATLTNRSQENLGVCFSPDGKRLATVATSYYQPIPAEIRIWDLPSQREILSFPGLTSFAIHAEFSANGEIVATADGDGKVRLWNLATGAVRILSGHSGYATGLKFSPDGNVLATGDQNGTIMLWDWTAGTVLRVLTGHQGPINELAISPDGQLVASASRDHTARLWNLHSGDEVARFLGHTDRVWSLDFSPDGRTLATAGLDGVRFWSTAPNREGEILTHTKFEMCHLGFSPDGRFLFLDEGRINQVILFDAVSKASVRTLPGRDIHFSPNGKILALIRDETNAVIYETATMRLMGTIPGNGVLNGGTAISPDGRLLALRRGDKPVIMDLAMMSEITALDSGSSNGSSKELGFTFGGRLELTGAQTLHSGSGKDLVFTPDSKTLIAEEEGGIRLWNTSTWRPIRWLCSTTNRVQHLALSGDGSLLASSSGETVRLWNLKTQNPLDNFVLGQTPSYVTSLAFSPDGSNVAAGTYDGPIQLWNVPGRQEIGSFKLHRSIVRALAFSPDGHTLASQSYDSTVRLWTARAFQEPVRRQ